MTKELKQQYTLRITQANKSALVVILYEMTITYLEDAMKALRVLHMRGMNLTMPH